MAYSARYTGRDAQTTQPVVIKWVDPTPPGMGAGVSWGVPWTKGEIKTGQTFAALEASGWDGVAVADLADGVLAGWVVEVGGFATVAGPGAAGEMSLASGAGDTAAAKERAGGFGSAGG